MKKIWIDLDNSPHVLFFNPIIKELEKKGFQVVVTTRDYAQVIGLADLFKIKHLQIGRHYGKNIYLKLIGLVIRTLQMLPFIIKEKPDVAFSHGSRSQEIIAGMTGITSIVAWDYEHARTVPFFYPDVIIAPEVLLKKGLQKKANKILGYPGIKEDVYVPDFEPDSSILKTLNINQQDVIITIRPPATQAHYHNPKSDVIFKEVIGFIGVKQNVKIILLPRTADQGNAIKETWPEYFTNGKIMIPDQVVNGLNLMWYSDMVISGGGTIIREAAVLGVPAYSIFGGKIGAVDQYLSETRRLALIRSVEDVHNKVVIEKRRPIDKSEFGDRTVLETIVDNVSAIAEEL